MDHHYDAIVVGGRCAGAATAMLLAGAGMRVLVIEATRAGTDTVSTHALMRGGVLQLHRWGLLDAVVAAGTPAIVSTEFAYGGEIETIDIRARGGTSALRAPRRTLLDLLLLEAAQAAGAEVRAPARVTGLLTDGSRVRGVELDALHNYERTRNRLSQPLFDITERIASFQWDLVELREHLQQLSHAMRPEVDALLALDQTAAA
jgi:2-polyprenyl-6-methoxyphenol hydroxylase-like FAD-dependent oxidoreductase